MDAWYINLDKAIDRRELMESQIKAMAYSFDIKRFSAIDGKSAPNKPDYLSDGQWGCWQSHLTILENSLSNAAHLLILEDDEMLSTEIDFLCNALDNIPSNDWDLIYLDATIVEIEDFLRISRAAKELTGQSESKGILKLPPQSTIYGLHGYIINKDKKSLIYEILSKNASVGIPIDNVFAAAIQENRIKAQITIPFFGSPSDESKKSQITTSEHPSFQSWIDYRKSMSVISLKPVNSNYLKIIQTTTAKAVSSRLNEHILDTYSPYIGRLNKLR